ncbi:hypothetical protein [Roseivirga sp.]|uniref:hypothetical protein n=1 Tax=Roseivirga sp. TaxID=1964215 RepID=UPI003B8D2CC0
MRIKTDKNASSNVSMVLLSYLLLVFITSCGGDDTPELTPQEIAEQLLETSWSIANGGSITLDQVDVSDRYQGFSLTIGDATYTTLNAGELFPASGTWEWVGTTDNMVTTGSGKEITITNLSETQIVFRFLKNDQNSAFGIPGNYTITLSR